MTRTIKASYRGGKIEPLEPLDLPEGSELVVSITTEAPDSAAADATLATAGAWKDLLDCELFEKEVYETRLQRPRPPVQL